MTPALLYVEDEPTQARAMVRWLTSQGWDVTHAATAAKAEHYLGVHDWDAIVTDWDLGGTTAEPVVLGARDRRIPCVIYSGSDAPYLPRITKPDLDDLREWLDGARRAAA